MERFLTSGQKTVRDHNNGPVQAQSGQVIDGGRKGVQERRAFGRRRSRLTARVTIPGHHAITCVVADISEQGAYLSFDHPVRLPLWFRLVVEGYQVAFDCEVRRETKTSVGVLFLSGDATAIVADIDASKGPGATAPSLLNEAPRPAAAPATGSAPRRPARLKQVY